jgi:hypothetical protein
MRSRSCCCCSTDGLVHSYEEPVVLATSIAHTAACVAYATLLAAQQAAASRALHLQASAEPLRSMAAAAAAAEAPAVAVPLTSLALQL